MMASYEVSKRWSIIFVVIGFYIGGSNGLMIVPPLPREAVVGGAAELTCSKNENARYPVDWKHQPNGTGIKVHIYSELGGGFRDGYKDFVVNNDNLKGRYTISVSNVTMRHNGTYFCVDNDEYGTTASVELIVTPRWNEMLATRTTTTAGTSTEERTMISNREESRSTVSVIITIVLVTCSSLVLIAVTVLIGCLYRNDKLCCNNKRDAEKDVLPDGNLVSNMKNPTVSPSQSENKNGALYSHLSDIVAPKSDAGVQKKCEDARPPNPISPEQSSKQNQDPVTPPLDSKISIAKNGAESTTQNSEKSKNPCSGDMSSTNDGSLQNNEQSCAKNVDLKRIGENDDINFPSIQDRVLKFDDSSPAKCTSPDNCKNSIKDNNSVTYTTSDEESPISNEDDEQKQPLLDK